MEGAELLGIIAGIINIIVLCAAFWKLITSKERTLQRRMTKLGKSMTKFENLKSAGELVLDALDIATGRFGSEAVDMIRKQILEIKNLFK